ncbi:MAG: hypothetical protein ACLQHS_08525, partial [Candidatus Limnocylindrales bacterium]
MGVLGPARPADRGEADERPASLNEPLPQAFVGGSRTWHLRRLGRRAIGSARQDLIEPLGEREAAGVSCGSRSKARHLVGTAASKHEKPCPEIETPLHERAQQDSPGRCRLGGRLAVVEQFAPAPRIDRVGRQDHSLRRRRL